MSLKNLIDIDFTFDYSFFLEQKKKYEEKYLNGNIEYLHRMHDGNSLSTFNYFFNLELKLNKELKPIEILKNEKINVLFYKYVFCTKKMEMFPGVQSKEDYDTFCIKSISSLIQMIIDYGSVPIESKKFIQIQEIKKKVISSDSPVNLKSYELDIIFDSVFNNLKNKQIFNKKLIENYKNEILNSGDLFYLLFTLEIVQNIFYDRSVFMLDVL